MGLTSSVAIGTNFRADLEYPAFAFANRAASSIPSVIRQLGRGRNAASHDGTATESIHFFADGDMDERGPQVSEQDIRKALSEVLDPDRDVWRP